MTSWPFGVGAVTAMIVAAVAAPVSVSNPAASTSVRALQALQAGRGRRSRRRTARGVVARIRSQTSSGGSTSPAGLGRACRSSLRMLSLRIGPQLLNGGQDAFVAGSARRAWIRGARGPVGEEPPARAVESCSSGAREAAEHLRRLLGAEAVPRHEQQHLSLQL